MFRDLAHLIRLLRVVWTLARHGATLPLEWLEMPPWAVAALRRLAPDDEATRPGERLAEALQSLGPSFIKFGQSLAVRGDLIGETMAEDLSALQDRLPPFPSEIAKTIVARELDAPIRDLFTRFEDEPVAAASIAQVHFAETQEGEFVAVKVLRPGIEAELARDIAFFHTLARWIEYWRPEMRRLKPVEIVRNFQETVDLEMDLRLEAAAASELGENFADDPEFEVPAVDWKRTARRVLTLARVEGIPIDEIDRIEAAGIAPGEVLARSARIFFKQVFRDGFFHADMHPGNMFVATDGTLAPVDFGIMGRLDSRTRNFLADMLLGFLQRDYRRVADVHFAAGYVPPDQSRDAFMQASRAIAEPIFGKPQHEISIARLLGQLFHVTRTFEMETQPQLLLLQKTMLVAEGVGRRLDPETSIWILAEPLIEEWMRENRSPEARLREAAGEIARRVEHLPALLAKADDLAAMVTADGLRLHPDTIRDLRGEENRSSGWRLAALVALGLLILALAV